MNRSSQEQLEHDLHAYFDGELDDATATQFESELAEHPALKARFEDLQFLRSVVGKTLESAGEQVDAARFEQAWDAFDAHLDREARLKHAVAEPPVSIWGRVSAFIKTPVAWGVGGAAAAAAVVFLVVGPGAGPSNTQMADASDQPAPNAKADEPEADAAPSLAPSPTHVADAESPKAPDAMTEFPLPEANNADVEIVDFAGHSGRISHIDGKHGTTTVIWVQEDDESVDSERSL